MEICKKNVLFIYMGVLMFLFSQVSSATDTISTNTPLVGLRTLISSSDIFELGLFNPNPGYYGNYYIGMWYKQVSPRTIVWVANRESPARYVELSHSSLEIADGNLILYNANYNEPIWSTGVNSSRSKDVQAVLLDNGNLVLRDGPTSAAVLWQSFDHPSDTWLPSAKINLGSQLLTSWKSLTDPSPGRYSLEFDHHSNSLITVWNGSKSYWSSRPWDYRLQNFDLSFNLSSNVRFQDINLRFKLNLDESYITYSINPNTTYHLFMDVSGRFRLQIWYDDLQEWGEIWSQPEEICAVYNYCGSFSICDDQKQMPCSCVPGFRHFGEDSNDYSVNGLSQYGENSSDFSSGCKRDTWYTCGDGNIGFQPLENMKLATDPTTLILTASHVTSCASACLANCSCLAYANDGNKCLMWTRDVFNLKQLDAAYTMDGHKIFYANHTFFLKYEASDIHGKVRRTVIIAVVLSSLAAAAAFFVGLYCCISSRRKKTQKDQKQSRELLEGGINDDDDGENICYLNLNDIIAATNAFSEENKLGEGGFGPVYKGKLSNGIDVAIKRLSKISSQGLTEFKNEVDLIIQLQHKNLVRLLGYCVEGDEKLLIYEYMSNKSLDVLLFDSLKCRELDWGMRMKIIDGTTRGLQYLHEDSRLRIIHRDLKASNILLDDDMNPKISDFGTARIFGFNQIDDSTKRIVGTFGYMSPEYALGGRISQKSDIYSFGVMLLEIISGKKATRFVHNDQNSLIDYAWESWCETKGVSIIDEALCGSYSVKEVMRCVHISLLCVQGHPNDRPTISQIVYMLSNDNTLRIPKQPTFSNVLHCDLPLVSSDYVATQTEMEAR